MITNVINIVLGFIIKSFMALLWYCADDTLASALGLPELGSLPLYVPVVILWFIFFSSISLRGSAQSALAEEHNQL